MSARFVPWPLPLALGLSLGTAASTAAQQPPLLGGALGMLLLLASGVALLKLRAWPTLWSPSPRFRWLLLLPVALGVGAGAVSYAAWEARQRPLPQALAGTAQAWRGYSDGATMHAAAPVKLRLALAAPPGGYPGGAAPVGAVTITGVADLAQGARNPGSFDYAAHLRRRGVSGLLRVHSYEVTPGLSMSRRLKRGVTAGLPPEPAALMAAITLGVRDELGELREPFGAAGLAHLLALSGLHVGVLLVAIERAVKRTGRYRPLILLVASGAFVWLVGPAPSVIRAVTMALAALLSRAYGAGRLQPLTALSLAATGGLLTAPQMIGDLSFQLSYLSVLGMLLFLPAWLKRLKLTVQSGRANLPRSWSATRQLLMGGMAVSVAAQLPTLSLVASEFGLVPLLSPVVNVLAVPLAGLLVPLGFLAGLVGLVGELPAQLVNLITGPLAALLIGIARVGAKLPNYPWHEIDWLGHALWGVTTTVLALHARGRFCLKRTAAVLLAALLASLAGPVKEGPPDVWVLDVGQGDAVLIRLGGGNGVLIDGGGAPFTGFDVGGRVVLPALQALGVTRLAAVVATHPDADHVDGLLSVLGALPVGLLLTGPEDAGAPLDAQLRAAAAQQGVPVHVARRGERLSVAGSGVSFDVLNPGARWVDSTNERSVALLLRYEREPRALFLGDLGVSTERELLVPPVDLLMVAHHGSRGSTGERLVRAALSKAGATVYAVISVGVNNYGHPTPEVVERLQLAGACVLVTREHGAVRYGLADSGQARGRLTPKATCLR